LRDRLARAARAIAVDAGLLRRRRDYRLLVAGQAISDLGSMITLVAVPVQTFGVTHSSVAVGLLGVAEFVPILALALVGGALADAFDRRRLVMIAEAGALVVVAGLVANSLLPDPHLWVLYVAAALIAACTAIRRPPLDALMPRLVEREELKSASRCSATPRQASPPCSSASARRSSPGARCASLGRWRSPPHCRACGPTTPGTARPPTRT
jgi:Na+/melibiose symporter-like transporter